MEAAELGIPVSEVAAGLAAEVLMVATKEKMRYSFDCRVPFLENLVPGCL